MDQDTSNDARIEFSAELDRVELLGKYRGSGLQEPPYLLRRRDGQVVQVSRLLYLIASSLDANRHPDPADRRPEAVAARVSIRFGQEVSPDNVTYLVERKLVPAGLIARRPGDGGVTGHADRANPLLSLRMRLPVVPERFHRRLSTACQPLFHPAIVATALVGLVVVDLWLILGQWHNLAAGARQLVYQPQLLLGITILTVVCAAFHEIGHAAAARYGGATPGAMGAGIYLVWPVFYTDVTDAYRLDRRGRLRTDLGGVYFNVLFTLATAAVHLATGYRPLLVFLVVAQLETLRQFLPFVRLDGYYVVSDVAGVPNLFAYMRPVLVTLLRVGDDESRRVARAKLAELQPRARAVITAWVCLTAPVLLVNVVAFLLLAPRFAGAAWGSAGGQFQAMTTQDRVDVVGVLNGIVGLVLLVLPLVGMTYVVVRLGARLSARAPDWWRARPLATATAGLVVATVVALQVAVKWPNTFASALEHAQVAQAIEEAHAEGRLDELAGLSTSPPAEPAMVPADSAAAGPTTTASTVPPAEASDTSWADESPARATAGTAPWTNVDADAASPQTAAETDAPTTSSAPDGPPRPTTRDVPGDADSDSDSGSGGLDGSDGVGGPSHGGPPTPTSTSTTTNPPAPSPRLVGQLIDLLF